MEARPIGILLMRLFPHAVRQGGDCDGRAKSTLQVRGYAHKHKPVEHTRAQKKTWLVNSRKPDHCFIPVLYRFLRRPKNLIPTWCYSHTAAASTGSNEPRSLTWRRQIGPPESPTNSSTCLPRHEITRTSLSSCKQPSRPLSIHLVVVWSSQAIFLNIDPTLRTDPHLVPLQNLSHARRVHARCRPDGDASLVAGHERHVLLEPRQQNTDAVHMHGIDS